MTVGMCAVPLGEGAAAAAMPELNGEEPDEKEINDGSTSGRAVDCASNDAEKADARSDRTTNDNTKDFTTPPSQRVSGRAPIWIRA